MPTESFTKKFVINTEQGIEQLLKILESPAPLIERIDINSDKTLLKKFMNVYKEKVMNETLKMEQKIFKMCEDLPDWFVDQQNGDNVCRPTHTNVEILFSSERLIVNKNATDVKCYIKRTEENAKLFDDFLLSLNTKSYNTAINFLINELGE